MLNRVFLKVENGTFIKATKPQFFRLFAKTIHLHPLPSAHNQFYRHLISLSRLRKRFRNGKIESLINDQQINALFKHRNRSFLDQSDFWQKLTEIVSKSFLLRLIHFSNRRPLYFHSFALFWRSLFLHEFVDNKHGGENCPSLSSQFSKLFLIVTQPLSRVSISSLFSFETWLDFKLDRIKKFQNQSNSKISRFINQVSK